MNNNINSNVAVVYSRVSTEDQANFGMSLGVQDATCTAAVARDGFKLLKVIRDEGKSAGTLKRPGIQEIIGLTVGNKIGAVYTVSSDRIARNTMDYLTLRDLLRKHNVQLRYLNQPTADDSAVSRMTDTMLASVHEMQRLIVSEKVKQNLYAKTEAGYFPASAPVGYCNVPNPDAGANKMAARIIVPDPVAAPLITEAFDLYATGTYSTYDLNDQMYTKGLRSKMGGKIAPNRFCEVLKNRIYIGEVHWGKVHVEKGKHQPLTDRETFDRVQRIMGGNNNYSCRRRKYTWLLNGFMHCFDHHQRYTAEWHLNKGIAYYHCRNRSGCGKYVEKGRLEDMVAKKFIGLEFNEDFIKRVLEKVQATFHGQRRNYDGKRQSLINQKTAFEAKRRVAEDKLFEKVISNEDFIRIRTEVDTAVANIDSKLTELSQQQNLRLDVVQEVMRLTENIYDAYGQASEPLKRLYLSMFWDRFEVTNGVIIKSDASLLFKELLRLEQVAQKNGENQKPPINGGSPLVINSVTWLRR